MLSILSGITKLWSLPVIKLSLVVVLTMSVYVYVSILDSQIEQQLLELERQDIELANNRITIATLTESISAANNATDEALAELVRVDKLAVNRAKKIKALTADLTAFEAQLNELGSTDEHVQDWSNSTIPHSVISLLKHTRDSNGNSYQDKESKTSSSIGSGLH